MAALRRAAEVHTERGAGLRAGASRPRRGVELTGHDIGDHVIRSCENMVPDEHAVVCVIRDDEAVVDE